MISVFGAFVIGDDPMVKMLGLGMATAILLLTARQTSRCAVGKPSSAKRAMPRRRPAGDWR